MCYVLVCVLQLVGNLQGHTVARNLESDGRVDTKQILHNINEGIYYILVCDLVCAKMINHFLSTDFYFFCVLDELVGFEEAWKENAGKHLPGWSEGFRVENGTVCIHISVAYNDIFHDLALVLP